MTDQPSTPQPPTPQQPMQPPQRGREAPAPNQHGDVGRPDAPKENASAEMEPSENASDAD